VKSHGTCQSGAFLPRRVLFLFLQAAIISAYLMSERSRIEDDAVRVLKNTALLQVQQFETSIEAMRYQLRVIRNVTLLDHAASRKMRSPS
jgi:hypothetical protein